jgi:outer membrane lipopolysaccharide assembly protein LptE/RlpB
MIKMDIEGAEAEALKGSRHTLRTYHPLLAIATENKENDATTIPKQIVSYETSYVVTFSASQLQSDNGIRPTVAFFRAP